MGFLRVCVCDDCWARREPGRAPYRVREAETEECYDCSKLTDSGIYLRIQKLDAP